MDEAIMQSIAFNADFASLTPTNLVGDVMHNYPFIIELMDGTILLPETLYAFKSACETFAPEILYAVSTGFNYSKKIML